MNKNRPARFYITEQRVCLLLRESGEASRMIFMVGNRTEESRPKTEVYLLQRAKTEVKIQGKKDKKQKRTTRVTTARDQRRGESGRISRWPGHSLASPSILGRQAARIQL
jgi:hypothetical protein